MTPANSSPIAPAIADGWQTMAEQEQEQELLPAISPSTPTSSTSTREPATVDGREPVHGPPSARPVAGRSLPEIRADLAGGIGDDVMATAWHCTTDGVTWPGCGRCGPCREAAVEVFEAARSLRGVVQAVDSGIRALHKNTGLSNGLGYVCDECEGNWSSGAGSVPPGCPTIRALRAALAAAADAPQPQRYDTKDQRPPAGADALTWSRKRQPIAAGGDCDNTAGPSPAVLPDPPTKETQR